MTPREMHIELDVRLQYMNSNRKDTVRAEVKDMVINQSILEVVDNRLPSKSIQPGKQGLEANTILYEDLKELTKFASLTTYVDSTISNSLYGVLPVDYYHLKSDRSTVRYDCNGITFPSTSSTTESVYILPFPDYTVAGIKYVSFSIKFNGILGTIYSYISHSLYTRDAKFQIVNEVLDYVNKIKTFSNGATPPSNATFEVYWEYYDNVFYQDSFIFKVITAASAMSTAILTYSGYAGVATALTTISRDYYNYSFGTTSEYPNRLTASDMVHDVNRDYYSKTVHDSPISTLDLQRIRVIINSQFIIQNIKIEYIKKPRMINYSMNISSELCYKLQNEVINVAARKVKAMVNDPSYKNVIVENQLSNQ